MNKELLNQLEYFKRVNIPKYIEANIQSIALKHLDLADMGKLRDRMEGELYYSRLRNDIFSEYAFEKLIGLRKFDWEKREKKNYIRKKYNFENKKLNLVLFMGDSLPKFSAEHVGNCIFIHVNADSRVLVSGLATKSTIDKMAIEQDSKIIELNDFKSLFEFNSMEDLVQKMD
ncbi:hypothetical protein BZG02_10685 [Labilibaculum filiforme]|uniref:Uncharacterized protein n=1 Tax=Labilibaculum filiforme TaxID=1940526 RepID=A0A2N3HYS1_9BACT|nr:hypothetical protein [Labilibaculum filiforme]PKQ63209.1 hypothetical protein BZG02_10685 [Labilibaculum filiforme]